MSLTGGKGVELVLDPLGGANWKKSYRALRATGRLGVFGASGLSGSRIRGVLLYLGGQLRADRFRLLSLMGWNRGVFGFNLGHLFDEREKVRDWMTSILAGVEEGWVRPYVGKTFRFDQVAEAHRFMESRGNTGKVILVP